MIILAIDGRELKTLNIIKYTPQYQLLDGEGTGRSKAPGWDLIREPQGIIANFSITIARTRTDNEDFRYFMEKFRSLGSREFVTIEHVDPLGQAFTQEMYFVVDAFDMERFEDGFAHTGDISARFIAKEGTVL